MNILTPLMPMPKPYGAFHLGLTIAGFALMAILLLTKKKFNIKYTLIGLFIVIFAGFIFKEHIFYTYGPMGGEKVNKIPWEVLPIQFCDTPIIMLPIAIFTLNTKYKKINKASLTYLATYGIIGGLSPLLVPSSLFTDRVLSNIETIIHHFAMVFTSLFIWKNNLVEDKESFKHATFSYLGFVYIAFILNLSLHNISQQKIELFYINPRKETVLPILNLVQKESYVIFLVLYLVLFIGVAYSVFEFGCNRAKIFKALTRNKNTQNA